MCELDRYRAGSSEEGPKVLTSLCIVNKSLRVALSSLLFSKVKRDAVVHHETCLFIQWPGKVSLKILFKYKGDRKWDFFGSRWKHLGKLGTRTWAIDMHGHGVLLSNTVWSSCTGNYSLWLVSKETSVQNQRNITFNLTHVMLSPWWGHSYHHWSRALTNERHQDMINQPEFVRLKKSSGIEYQDFVTTTG